MHSAATAVESVDWSLEEIGQAAAGAQAKAEAAAATLRVLTA